MTPGDGNCVGSGLLVLITEAMQVLVNGSLTVIIYFISELNIWFNN